MINDIHNSHLVTLSYIVSIDDQLSLDSFHLSAFARNGIAKIASHTEKCEKHALFQFVKEIHVSRSCLIIVDAKTVFFVRDDLMIIILHDRVRARCSACCSVRDACPSVSAEVRACAHW